MSANNLESWDQIVSVKDDLVSVSFNSDFGPINFSFNLEKFSEKLLKTVSELLDRLHKEEPGVLDAIVKDTGVPIEKVKENLAAHILGTRKTTKLTAIEKFTQGRNLALEGSLQQLLDNLPASILLMLIHLTAAAIMFDVKEGKRNHKPLLSLMEHELSAPIYAHLKSALYKLWEDYSAKAD
jgi:hypothetical protein